MYTELIFCTLNKYLSRDSVRSASRINARKDKMKICEKTCALHYRGQPGSFNARHLLEQCPAPGYLLIHMLAENADMAQLLIEELLVGT